MKGCRALRDREIRAVLKVLNEQRYGLRNKTLFLVGLKTGFRISELISIQVEDVYQGDRIIESLTIPRRNRKGKVRSHTIYLNKVAREAIMALILSGINGPWLFPSRQKGNHISAKHASRVLKEAFREADLDGAYIDGLLSTHSMRKTFAKKIYDLPDTDLKDVKDSLGHEKLSTTVDYLPEDFDRQKKILESV